MAKGIKTGGRDFQAGQSGNPAGRPRLDEETKQARALNRRALEILLNKYIYCSPAFLDSAIKDKSLPAIDHMVIAIIRKAFDTGDYVRLNFIIEQICGKLPSKPPEDPSGAGLTFADFARIAAEAEKNQEEK